MDSYLEPAKKVYTKTKISTIVDLNNRPTTKLFVYTKTKISTIVDVKGEVLVP